MIKSFSQERFCTWPRFKQRLAASRKWPIENCSTIGEKRNKILMRKGKDQSSQMAFKPLFSDNDMRFMWQASLYRRRFSYLIPSNENTLFLSPFFMQESLITMKIKANFTTFMMWLPVINM